MPAPETLRVQVPAEPGFLPAIRSAVTIAVRRVGADASCTAGLRSTADELAGELLHHARPWAHFDIDIVHDDEDVYLRMAVEQEHPQRSLRVTMQRLVFAGLVDSVDVRTEGTRIYGVAQRALRRPNP